MERTVRLMIEFYLMSDNDDSDSDSDPELNDFDDKDENSFFNDDVLNVA